jgi:hypothetical protein
MSAPRPATDQTGHNHSADCVTGPVIDRQVDLLDVVAEAFAEPDRVVERGAALGVKGHGVLTGRPRSKAVHLVAAVVGVRRDTVPAEGPGDVLPGFVVPSAR